MSLFLYASVKDSVHGQKIKRVRQTLLDFIRRLDHILSSLLERGAITPQEFELLRSQQTIYHCADKLLNVLSVKPVETYECFLKALEATQQQHLHSVLEEKGKYISLLIDTRQIYF